MNLFKILFLLFFLSCSYFSAQVRTHKPFINQRLVVRHKYPNMLTNQICKKKKNGECVEWSIKKYDLGNASFRKLMNDAKIPCQIAGKRWRVCLDSAGYCRRHVKCLKWKDVWWDFKEGVRCVKKKQVEEFIPATSHDYLVQAKTVCYKK